MARTSATVPSGCRITDRISLGVLSKTVPAPLIDAVLAETGRQSQRQRQLPARVVVYYYVIALTLYARASYGEVLRCLLEGLRWLHGWRSSLPVASKSGISQARTRPGAAPLKCLFERVAIPLADRQTPGAWYRGRRLVSLDGTTVDVADVPDNVAAFGRPAAARGRSGFPQLRLVALTETGPRAMIAAAAADFATGETTLARRVIGALGADMLCLADRGFVGFAPWSQACATGAALLWRVRRNQVFPCHRRLPDGSSYLSKLYASSEHRRRDDGLVVRVIEYRLDDDVPGAEPLYRLITTLRDPATAPAAERAALYHERWESETAFAGLKTSLPGGRLLLRSKTPELVWQEFYGLLLAPYAIRRLMHEASAGGELGPGPPLLHPHGPDRAAKPAVPRRLFPRGSAMTCIARSWSRSLRCRPSGAAGATTRGSSSAR